MSKKGDFFSVSDRFFFSISDDMYSSNHSRIKDAVIVSCSHWCLIPSSPGEINSAYVEYYSFRDIHVTEKEKVKHLCS